MTTKALEDVPLAIEVPQRVSDDLGQVGPLQHAGA